MLKNVFSLFLKSQDMWRQVVVLDYAFLLILIFRNSIWLIPFIMKLCHKFIINILIMKYKTKIENWWLVNIILQKYNESKFLNFMQRQCTSCWCYLQAWTICKCLRRQVWLMLMIFWWCIVFQLFSQLSDVKVAET